MDNQNLFSQTYSEIVKNIIGDGASNFQMLNNPMSFNWPVAAIGQIAPQAYQLMSMAPVYSPVSDFTGVGTSTLFDNYRMVLSHVGYSMSNELKAQVQKLSDQATTAQNAMNKAEADMNTAYNTAKQNGGAMFAARYPAITDWANGPGKSYDETIAVASNQADKINQQIIALTNANYPTDLQDAIKLMTKPAGSPSGGNVPDGWAIVPDGAGVLRWQPSFTISTTSQDWRAQLTNGTIGQKTISLSASKSDSSINQSWAGASVSYGTPFWGFYASSSWKETNITENDDSVAVEVTLQSATTVPITPGAWYNGGFLKQLAIAGNDGSGYQILDPYKATGTDHALFGQDGLCSTMVTGLVVAYKPSFSVTMASSTYKEHQMDIEAAAGFRIGPFSFGGEGGHFEKDVNTTGNTTTFTGGSTSDDPVILGVTVGFPGVDKP